MNSVQEFFYRKLGQRDSIYVRPPLDHRKLYIAGQVVSLNNDGFETWIGYPDKWLTHFKNDDFRKITLWFMYMWICVDWFGLRSWIWYKLLAVKCRKPIMQVLGSPEPTDIKGEK